MGYLVYFSIVRAKLVVNSPYNQRQDAYAQSVIRGKLVDKNGNTLAETVVDEDGNESRNYPYGELLPMSSYTVMTSLERQVLNLSKILNCSPPMLSLSKN